MLSLPIKDMKKMQTKDGLIAFLESRWPGRPSKEIKEAFSELKKMLREPPKLSKGGEAKSFNMLDIVRRTCATHDFYFLSRQITYHISATADMPLVLGNAGQVEAVISEIIGFIARRAPHNGRIDIEVKQAIQRSRPIVEVLFKAIDEKIGDIERAEYIKRLFGEGPILACKEAVAKGGGQLVADLLEPRRPVIRLAFPTIAATPILTSEHEIFRYDISIKNISNVRKRFGIKKSHSLVAQIEGFVRSLVRHPIDIVTATHDKGTITAIYETQKGSAQSVASRISSRLGSEKFMIGKLVVELNFHYRLSALPSVPLRHEEL